MKRFALVVTLVSGVCALVTAQTLPPQSKPVPPASRDGAPSAPPQPAGTGAISGILVAADNGRPVRRAQVSLSGGDTRIAKSVTTDDRGNFAFTTLPTGDFTLTASKGGYLTSTYGQQKPGTGQAGTPIHLVASQRVERLSLPIMRGGVITGTVLDEFGDPAFGTPVRAMRYSWRSGERSLQTAGSGTTDDRGIYRIPALPPGDYIISAIPRDSQDAMAERMMAVEEMAVAAAKSGVANAMEDAKLAMARANAADAIDPTSGYAPVYFPGTTQPSSATTFALGAGEERGNIDLQLQLLPLVTITGNVTSTQQMGPASIQLIDRTQPTGVNSRSARSGPDGSFTIRGVLPGSYVLVARASSRESAPAMPDLAGKSEAALMEAKMAMAAAMNGNQLWGMLDVVVDGRSKPNVTVPVQPGMTVSGVVKFDGGAQSGPPQLQRVSLMLSPFGALAGDFSSPVTGNLDSEGRFTLRGVIPGTYRVVGTGGIPSGYSLKSAVFSGRDTLDFPLEIRPGEDQTGGLVTFGVNPAELTGTLVDGAGKPATGYTVVLFAADARYWTPQSRRILTTRPSTDGRFTFRNLPAGDYRLGTVTDLEQGQQYDPALLRQLLGASTPIKLEDGERKTQELKIR